MLKKNQIFNFNYFVNLGLHLGNRTHNRKIWIFDFVLGSRVLWDILNIIELFKRLEILGPFLINVVKNGGTILIVNKQMNLESKLLGNLFSSKPYLGIVYLYIDR